MCIAENTDLARVLFVGEHSRDPERGFENPLRDTLYYIHINAPCPPMMDESSTLLFGQTVYMYVLYP